MSTQRNVVPAGLGVGYSLPQLTSCPECGAPAEITRRAVMESTHGPVEHVALRCIQRHIFLTPTFLLDPEVQSQL